LNMSKLSSLYLHLVDTFIPCLTHCPVDMAMSNEEIVATVTAALETAIKLVEEDDWNEEKVEREGVVKSKINKDGRKIWLCTATVNVAPQVLEKKMMDIDNLTSWNNTITESKVLKNLKKDVFVSYQVTAEGGGGLVSARDFVYGGRAAHRGGKFIVGGMSVEFEGEPETGGKVRAWHGPSCQIISPVDGVPDKSSYTWLMDCEYRGMIPGSIINIALPRAQLMMVQSINSLGEDNI
jgi:hypothetical protein